MLERVKSNCVLCAEFTKLFSNMRVLYTISSTRISLFHKDIFWEILSFCSCCYCFVFFWRGGFLGSSAGQESACSAGDPGSIPVLGRSAGEGIGYPLQCFWFSLVAQVVKNLPAMQETPVQFLGQEDLLEKG